MPPRLSLRVLRCPPRGRCACGPAKPVSRPLLARAGMGNCPHGRPLRVAPCPPRGPLRLRSGEASSAALAGIALKPPRLPLRVLR